MSNSFSDAVNKILSENKSIDINQSGKTLVEKVNDVQIDRDGQDKFHQEKKLLGPSRFKKWFKRRTLKKSDMTDQEQEQHHQDNRKLAAAGVKDSVEYTGEPMNETHAPGSVEMIYGKHKVINTGKEDRYGFQMFDVHKGGKRTHNNVRLSTAKKVLDDARNRNTERANRKLENPQESVELGESDGHHYHVTNIDYETDGNEKIKKSLPKSMKVHVPHDVVKDGEYAITDHINDHISDETGWLHHGYDMKRVKKESVELGEDDLRLQQQTDLIKKRFGGRMADRLIQRAKDEAERTSSSSSEDENSSTSPPTDKPKDTKPRDPRLYSRQKQKTYRNESVELDESNFGYRSAKVRGPIDVTAYRDSHGKRPYHAEEGNWYFSAEPGGKPVHKSGPNTTYRDAKKGAEEFARKNNHRKLYVMSSYDATSAADDFLNELSQEFGAENITLDTIMENIDELETLLTSLKEYFGVEGNKDPVTILSAEEQASTDDPYEQHEMAVQKLKDIINKERNEETTKESNNGK